MTPGIFPGPRQGALHVLGGLGFRAAVVSASVFGHAAVLALSFSGEPAVVDTGSVIVVELVDVDGATTPTPPEETERVSVEPSIVVRSARANPPVVRVPRDASPRIVRAGEEPDNPAPPALPLTDARPPRKPPVAVPPARATHHVEPNPSPTEAGFAKAGLLSGLPAPPGEEVSAAPAVPAQPTEEALAPPAVPVTPLAGNPKPDYPAEALRRGIEGRVVLRIAVSAVGGVEQASVVATSGHAALDAAALAAVRAWRFRPARRLGVAVSSEARIPFVFRIRDDGR